MFSVSMRKYDFGHFSIRLAILLKDNTMAHFVFMMIVYMYTSIIVMKMSNQSTNPLVN